MTPFQWFIVVVVLLYIGRDAYDFLLEWHRRRQAFKLAIAALRAGVVEMRKIDKVTKEIRQ